MKKILLLTVGLFSISTAYSMCVPSNLPRCKCQFPVFDGKELKCGEDYCEKVGKICMDDGSCCEAKNYCQSDVSTQCCAENQICDSSEGCILIDDGCEWVSINSTSFCIGNEGCSLNNGMKFCSPSEAKSFCNDRNLTLASIYDVCPDFDASKSPDLQCLSILLDIEDPAWFWTSTKVSDMNIAGTSYPTYYVVSSSGNGARENYYGFVNDRPVSLYYRIDAICIEK